MSSDLYFYVLNMKEVVESVYEGELGKEVSKIKSQTKDSKTIIPFVLLNKMTEYNENRASFIERKPNGEVITLKEYDVKITGVMNRFSKEYTGRGFVDYLFFLGTIVRERFPDKKQLLGLIYPKAVEGDKYYPFNSVSINSEGETSITSESVSLAFEKKESWYVDSNTCRAFLQLLEDITPEIQRPFFEKDKHLTELDYDLGIRQHQQTLKKIFNTCLEKRYIIQITYSS